MSVVIYHNPACGTSRAVLALIRESGAEVEIVPYLKTPPSRERLKELIGAMGVGPRAILRKKDALYDELGLDDPKWSDDELIDIMVERPVLIERPIVASAKGVRLCRPAEKVLEILPE